MIFFSDTLLMLRDSVSLYFFTIECMTVWNEFDMGKWVVWFFFSFWGSTSWCILWNEQSRPNSFLYFSSDTFVWLVINNLPCIVSCIDFYNGFGFFCTWFTIFHFLRPPVAPLHDSFSSCTMFLLFMLTVHTVRYCQYMHVFSYQSKNNCSA